MNIQELQEQRAEADKQLAAAQHKQNMDTWKKARTECRAAKERAQNLLRAFKQAEASANSYELKCGEQQQLIDSHTRPEPEDFPTDEEMRKWEDRRVELLTTLTGPMREKRLMLAHAKETARTEVLTADEQFKNFQYAEQTARTKALNESPSHSSASFVG